MLKPILWRYIRLKYSDFATQKVGLCFDHNVYFYEFFPSLPLSRQISCKLNPDGLHFTLRETMQHRSQEHQAEGIRKILFDLVIYSDCDSTVHHVLVFILAT